MVTPTKSGTAGGISIKGIKVDGDFIRKTILAVVAAGAASGGMGFYHMHNSEMDTLKTGLADVQKQVNEIQGSQKTIIEILRKHR